MEAIYEERVSTVEVVDAGVDAAEVESRVRGHLELVRRLAWKSRGRGCRWTSWSRKATWAWWRRRAGSRSGVCRWRYAQQWIRARIRAYVSRTWSVAGGRAPWIVFQLRRERARLEARWGEGHPEVMKRLAEALGKREEEVTRGSEALGKDVSLNAPLGWEGDVTQLDMLESTWTRQEDLADRDVWARKLHQSVAEAWPELDAREQALVKERMLVEDGVSAELLARRFGVTAVRIRQIEQGLRQKLRQRLTAGCTAWDGEALRLAA